jgi:hypothetical protein
VVAYRVARLRHPQRVFLLTGLALGAVIAPLSLGLYATYFIPYIGFLPGMIGLLLVMIHSAPGFHLARLLGIVSPAEIIAGGGDFWFVLLNAIVWAFVYGCLGWAIDWFRQYKCKEGGCHGHG